MTGAGFALPLLAASGAHAADTATWDKVAQCETGGVWSAASGNSYYGGLQLTQEMWDNYGGSAYASRPDLASRSQQIAVAESILDHRGPDVWSSCAVSAGLTKDGQAPEVDPGSTATPSPAPSDDGGSPDPWDSSGTPDASDSAGTHDRPGDEPSDPTPSPDGSDSAGTHEPGDEASGPATPGGRADDPSRSTGPSTDPSRSTGPSDDPSRSAGPSADPSEGGSRTDTSGTPHKTPAQGKHRGGAGDEDADDGGRSSGGRHASRGDAERTGPAADGDYTVRPGDTLSAIASAHRLSGGWSALYDRNEDVIGSDADLIKPGQLLDLGHPAG
ncbi:MULTISPECIES: transglycosylase family protein [unclassified Streptomyces]|uniref:transglycosylase family protein n=1 Tax=unclassified Streptomyces TaxID=2593676 RepID=UPI002733E0AA|nr:MULTISPECIES: transglycosylase family protein [unclassified Streptomyces]